jgi:predicted nucleic acid-binding protein
MISAVDTNILLDLARPNPEFVDNAIDLLEVAGEEGGLVVCPIVQAELSAHFGSAPLLEEFLARLGITGDHLSDATCWTAGQAWHRYRQAGGKRERIISDFLIGAHATHQAGRLLARDRGFYRSYFPDLEVVQSSADLL